MTTKQLFMTLACGLLAPAYAQPNPGQAASDRPAAECHPYLEERMYPQWSRLTPEQGMADIRLAIAQSRERMEAICRVQPGEESYENCFGALERMDEPMNVAYSYYRLLCNVMDNPERRAGQALLLPELSAWESEVVGNERLWAVLKRAGAAPWVKELSPERQRHVQQVLERFRMSGADLSPEARKRMAAIEQELASLTNTYAKNILDATAAWEMLVRDPAQLAGCSESWMEMARAAAAKKGYGSPEAPCWLVTLSNASAGEIMRHCDVEATRRACYEASNEVGRGGSDDNEAIVARVMELRQQKAALLGYRHYADLRTADRMAQTGERALAFVDELMERVKPAFERECAELMRFVHARSGGSETLLRPWNYSYYMNRLSEQRYALDPAELRPYFPEEAVVEGMFRIFCSLYGIRISERPTACLKPGEACPAGHAEVWHPEVRLFEVHDAQSGQHLGSFYMDLYPRREKRSGAWVQPVRYGTPATGGKPHEPHLAMLVANLSPAAEGAPALFSHRDVETLFHEFGHVMHNLLSDAPVKAHMGTRVAKDFVELPSQIQENWTWEPSALALMARHWQTGAPLPTDMVGKLRASRNFMPATAMMRQLCLSKLDLEMHMHYAEHFADRPLDEATDALLAPWRLATTEKGPSIARNFQHIISGGYGAGYYSYKWAEVLSADAWSRYEKEGILNPATGRAFRESILKQGGGRDAGELYRQFMGREPDAGALLRASGL